MSMTARKLRLSGISTGRRVAAHLTGLCLMGSLLALPLASAKAQDAQSWDKPWDKAPKAAARPAAPAAPSKLGGSDEAEAPPYAPGGGYGNAPTYGTTPSYGASPAYGNSPSYGNSQAPNGSAQGYGNSGPGFGQAQQGGYGSPAPAAPGYGSQSQGYGTPAPSYGGSQGGNGAPAPGYGGTSPGYGSPSGRGNDAYQPPRTSGGTSDGYGAPYGAPPQAYDPEPPAYGAGQARPAPRYGEEPTPGRQGSGNYYSQNEITQAGHGFFGSVTRGLASAIEYTFQKAGRPNGYILGEDGGGAFIAGLRYGEGTLFTKDIGQHKVYWQGPSLGYDIGAEGSKTMVLVYNMRDVQDLFNRFGGIEGSAYAIGGVSIQFQKYGDVSLALIRSGVGLRLGANVGYLKYSQKPTWNPF
jgi:hypothetical protein